MTRGEPVQSLTVPIRTRLAFGIGASAENMSLYSLSILGMLFYNQVLGLDVLVAGLVPTIATLTDAISDPLFGSFSDRYRSRRWGRRHPFMLIAPLPIALSFYCVFSRPEGHIDCSALLRPRAAGARHPMIRVWPTRSAL